MYLAASVVVFKERNAMVVTQTEVVTLAEPGTLSAFHVPFQSQIELGIPRTLENVDGRWRDWVTLVAMALLNFR